MTDLIERLRLAQEIKDDIDALAIQAATSDDMLIEPRRALHAAIDALAQQQSAIPQGWRQVGWVEVRAMMEPSLSYISNAYSLGFGKHAIYAAPPSPDTPVGGVA